MAVSQTEVQVLLNMRAAGQQSIDLFSGGLGKVGSEAGKAAPKLADTEKGIRGTGVASTAAGVALGVLAERVGRGLVGAFKSSIVEANRLDAGLIGLSSVARAFSQDAGLAQDAAKRLASDGLLNVGEAASGLKNLLAAGFGLDQAIVLMDRFKDSAAFGRQGSLDFGQAIVSATEGIKNGNSILVDNAGVTKNLSIILTEAGFSAQDLSRATTDAGVRQALFNGILKETNPQLGDTERLLKTAAGAQAQFSSQVTIAQQQIGKGLQPVLGAVLTVLTPFVQGVGALAPVLVPAGIAVGALVGPLVAMRAAAALGIPSLTGLGGVIGGVATHMKALALLNVGSVIQLFTGSLVGLGANFRTAATSSAGFITSLGALRLAFLGVSAVAIAGAVALVSWKQAQADARVAAETAGAVQDVINRAISLGAGKHIEYADAIAFVTLETQKYNNEAGRTILQKAAEINILERSGKISADEAIRRRIALEDEKIMFTVAQNRALVNTTLAETQNRVAREIGATGLALPDLIQKFNEYKEAGIELPKSLNLSAEATTFLEKKSKELGETQKAGKKSAEEYAAEIQKQRDALEQLGIVTLPGVQARLKELNTLVERARIEGADVTLVVRALWPEYEALAKAAKLSGVGVDLATAALETARRTMNPMIDDIAEWERNATRAFDPSVFAGIQMITPEMMKAELQTAQLSGAFKAFGISTRKELQDTADAAVRNYEIIRASGEATPAQIKEAFKKAKDAINAANGEIPSFWQTQVVPGVVSSLKNLETAIEGSFAQMLIGAKGFQEGFVDIWKSIKASLLNIFNDIANDFIKFGLNRILGAITGGKAGITGGLGDILKGGIPGLGGGGGAGLAIPTLGTGALPGAATVTGAGGGGAAGGLGSLGGIAVSGLLGGAAAGGAGFGLGTFLGSKFGKTAGTVGGGLSGAATGALIGSIVPGIGTAVGALIGGLSGVIGGLFGAGKKEKAGRLAVDEIREQIDSTLTAQQRAEAGNEQWKKDVIAVRDAYLATGKSEQQALADVQQFWAASKQGPEAVAAAFAPLAAAIDAAKQKQIDMAAIVDQSAHVELEADTARTARLDELSTQLAGVAAERQKLIESLANEAPEQARVLQRHTGSGKGGIITLPGEMGVIEARTLAQIALLNKSLMDLEQQIAAVGESAPAGLDPILTGFEQISLAIEDTGTHVTELGEVTFKEAGEAGGEKLTETISRTIQEWIRRGGIVGPFGKQFDLLANDALQSAGQIADAFENIDIPPIDVEINWDIPPLPDLTPPPNGNGEPPPGAQHGIFANRPTLTWFGEGGEAEVGGPQRFFKDIFSSLGIGGQQGGGAGGPSVVNFNVQAIDVDNFESWFLRRGIPIYLEALETNRDQILTRSQKALGVR